VIVDAANKKIKPTVVNARTTLILRNIPTDAPEAEVSHAFLPKLTPQP
jgi:hypothetical protein